VAAYGLLLPPASRPRLRRSTAAGRAAPRPPVASPPVRPSAHGSPEGLSRQGVGASAVGNRRLSTVRSDTPPQARASEARQAEGRTPVGKGGGRCGVVGSLLSTNPCRPPFVHRAGKACFLQTTAVFEIFRSGEGVFRGETPPNLRNLAAWGYAI